MYILLKKIYCEKKQTITHRFLHTKTTNHNNNTQLQQNKMMRNQTIIILIMTYLFGIMTRMMGGTHSNHFVPRNKNTFFVTATFHQSMITIRTRTIIKTRSSSHSLCRIQQQQNTFQPYEKSNRNLNCDRQQHPPFLLFSSTSSSTTTTSDKDLVIEKDVPAVGSSSIYVQEVEALTKLQSTFLKTLRDRGFLHQCTGITALDELLSTPGACRAAYLGFDATADSLHVGSLLQIMILKHLQQSGHKPVVLVGGGTSKVGDPTGKDESRILLTDEIIQQNIRGITNVFDKFLSFGTTNPNDAIIVNNDDWLSQLKYLDFLRVYGTQFTINRMLSFESVKQRLTREAPFSFLEFNYMILQAYDFLELNRRHDCILQLGGSDQWGNMVAGTELGRKVDSVQLYALTAPLITTSDGKKMGKTANGAIWLNKDKLSEYDYWQFWRNTADADVIRFLKLFTELPLEQITELEQLDGANINQAKIILADEATKLLHGPECLLAIRETVNNMFTVGGGGTSSSSTESLPRTYITKTECADGIKVIDLFVTLKLASSKKEARRLIQGGGAKMGIEESKIEDENTVLTLDSFTNSNEIVFRAGKKRAGVVELID